MTKKEEKQIAGLNALLKNEVRIRLVITDDDRSRALKEFCDELTSLAPLIRVNKDKEEGDHPPRFGIDPSLYYQAVPSGTMLASFLEMLSHVDQNQSRSADTMRQQLSKIQVPAMMKLYVSRMCPHCPLTIKKLSPLALANKAFKLTIIDGTFFPEMAVSDKVKSVPTLILDDRFSWTGDVDLDELFHMIQHRNPSELGAASLKAMIQDGDAYRMADMMLSEGKIFPAFMDLLTHAEFSIRLGAMAVGEDISDRDTGLAAQMVGPLKQAFTEQTEQIQGDILYIIGLSGDDGIIPFLETIAAGRYADDVKEAATEAIETIVAKKTV